MHPSSLHQGANRLFDFILLWLLPIGYFLLLSALFYLPDRSLHHKLYYALFSIPTLLALCLRPSELRNLLREPIVLLFSLFALYATLSITWTTSDEAAGSLIKRPLHTFMLFAGTCLMLRYRYELLKPLLLGSAVLALLASIRELHGFALVVGPMLETHDLAWIYTTGVRLVGTGALDNPLLSSHLFGFFFTYWLCMCINKSKEPLALSFCLIALLVMFIAIAATGSRTPLVALALVVCWVTFLHASRRSLAMLLTLLAVAGIGLACAPEIIVARGSSHRFEIWSLSWQMFLQHPLIGSGYDAPMSIDVGLGYPLSEPHNFALGVLYNVGLIGFLPWIGMIGYGLYTGWRNRRHWIFVLASALLVFGIGAGLTEGGGILSRPKEHWFLLWIPLALIAALDIAQRAGRVAAVEPQRISPENARQLIKDGNVIEEDGLGPKVLRLQDGSFLKLFRRRRWYTSGNLNPYSQRFANNSQCLRALGVASPLVLDLYIFQDNSQGVRYQPLPGQTLRHAFTNSASPAARKALSVRVGRFIAQLHELGIYFRSLHLGNVLLLENDEFGLIDVADMRILPSSLSWKMRQRNLRHMQRYPEDRHWLFEENIEFLLEGYANVGSSRNVQLIRKRLQPTG
ncbi:O-antigen ligase family protein [Pseudomonas bharatica]|uniref:O-antigen ligase family protein n=1 Tax=Pseudomonas bharatica TaxID=2692112 RepID=UPI003B2800EB